MPEYEVTGWNDVPAPANTPRPVIGKLNRTMVEALKTPEIQKFPIEQGFEPAGSRPEEFARLMHSDIENPIRVTREAGIRAQQLMRGITHMWNFLFALGWTTTLVVT